MPNEVTLSVSEARQLIELLDDEDFDDLASAIDQAQGDVHSGQAEHSSVTIKIEKD